MCNQYWQLEGVSVGMRVRVCSQDYSKLLRRSFRTGLNLSIMRLVQNILCIKSILKSNDKLWNSMTIQDRMEDI